MRRTAALIAGGGPAGAVAAARLAQAGTRALVLERHALPQDVLCGGFVSWRTLAQLARVGVPIDRLGGHPVHRLRLLAGDRVREAALPNAAIGVSRRRLDALLLDHAERAGAGVERGVRVARAEGRVLTLADGGTVAGDALFLATGKHDLRGLPRDAAAAPDPTLGLRLRLPPAPHLRRLVGDAIELHLFDRGYAGLVLHEDGSANLCMAVRRSRLRAAGDVAALFAALWDEAPRLAERMADADPAAADAVANVPYGWRTARTSPGVFRLGDQVGVIPSLAGEGMGIAVASGVAAADAWAAGGAAAAEAFQQRFAGRLRLPLALAGTVWRAAERPVAARALVAFARPRLVDAVARATRVRGD